MNMMPNKDVHNFNKHEHDYASSSFFCTSCIQSTSNRLLEKNLIAHGTKIDKLFYGKFVPLRERKLLDKLVRTRAVYDDVRTRLLPGTDLDATERANLHNTHHYLDKQEIQEAKRSGTNFDLPKLKNVSKRDSHNNITQSAVTKRPEMVRRHGLQKGFRFKAKTVRSEPCTCTKIFGELVKTRSELLHKKIHMKQPQMQNNLEIACDFEEDLKSREDISDRRAPKRTQFHKDTIKKDFKSSGRKSVSGLTRKVRTDFRNSLERISRSGIRYVLVDEHEPFDNRFRIKNDSLKLLRQKNHRKHRRRRYRCVQCKDNQCVPEECFKLLKKRCLSGHKDHIGGHNHKHRILRKVKLRGGNGSAITMSNDASKMVQPYDIGVDFQAETEKRKLTSKAPEVQRALKIIEMKRKSVAKETNAAIQTGICREKMNSTDRTAYKPVAVGSREKKVKPEINIRKVRSFRTVSDSHVKVPVQRKKRKEPKMKVVSTSPRVSKEIPEDEANQTERISSSFSFNIEVPKDKPASNVSEKNATETNNFQDFETENKQQRTNRPSRFSQVQLKTKNKKDDWNNPKRISTNKRRKSKNTIITKNRSQSANIQESLIDTTHSNKKAGSNSIMLLPNECEPFTCVPNECNPTICLKRIKKAGSIYRTKSTNTFHKSMVNVTSQSDSNLVFKNIQTRSRQPEYPRLHSPNTSEDVSVKAVRLSSSFGFDSEFAKDNSCLRDMDINMNNSYLGLKNKERAKSYSTLSGSSTLSYDNNQSPSTFALLPYECETRACEPGICDPYECEKLIQLRRKRVRRHSKQFYARDRQKKTSVMQFNKYTSNNAVPKTNKIQSSVVNYSTGIHKYGFKNILNGKAVRVGSNFSFDIEFHKDTSKKLSKEVKIKPKVFEQKYESPPKIKLYEQMQSPPLPQIKQKKVKKSNIGEKVKRCFCVLKFRKKDKYRTGRKQNITMVNKSTNTYYRDYNELPPLYITNKGTRTKRLRYVPCKSNVCIPGQCDPYECLQRIQKQRYQQDFEGTRKVLQTKPESSIKNECKKYQRYISVPCTSHVCIPGKCDPYECLYRIQNEQYQQDCGATRKVLQSKPESPEGIYVKSYGKKRPRRAVKVSSNFSLKIEVSKAKPIKKLKNKRVGTDDMENKTKKTTLNNEDLDTNEKEDKTRKKEKLKKKQLEETTIEDNRVSQKENEKMPNNKKNVEPILKRCLCTLQLQKKK